MKKIELIAELIKNNNNLSESALKKCTLAQLEAMRYSTALDTATSTTELIASIDFANCTTLFDSVNDSFNRVINACNNLSYIYGTAQKPQKFIDYCQDFVFEEKRKIDNVERDCYQKCLLIANNLTKVFDMWIHAYKDTDSNEMIAYRIDFCLHSSLYEKLTLSDSMKACYKNKANYKDCVHTFLKCDSDTATDIITQCANILLDEYIKRIEEEKVQELEAIDSELDKTVTA